MGKRLLIVAAVFFISITQLYAQAYVVTGKVVDAETGRPITGASVFLSNTSIGTAANNEGLFTLHNIPVGKFDLVASSLGYETHVETINAAALNGGVTIKLKPKANELANVVVGTYEKDGWTKWGKLFTEEFIGISSNASNCIIKNHEVIKFRHSKKRNYLEAFADEPLLVENKALGYVIHYKLEAFAHDFKSSVISYYGFPLFEEMQGNARKMKRWKENRKEAYFGSTMHFMRCVYANKIIENGFEVRKMEKKENLEKKRIQALYKYLAGADGNSNFEERLPKDSVTYYNKILRQPDAANILHTQVLPGDSIAYAEDSVTAGIAFDDYLHITYKNKKVPDDYQPPEETPGSPGGYMTSTLYLVNRRPVYTSHNGAYYSPQDLLTSGYWAWSEKICNMLPFDYWPE